MSDKKNSQGKHQKIWAIFSLLIIASLLLSGCGSAAQAKVYKVGILVGLEFVTPSADGFKAGMADLGYSEDENITYDVQVVNFDIPTYQGILKKFVEDEVDLITPPKEGTVRLILLLEDGLKVTDLQLCSRKDLH